MAHTFLMTAEAKGKSAAIKFESHSKTTGEFMVTILTAPDVEPFKMMLEDGKWKLIKELPEQLRDLEGHLIDAASKFQR